MVPSVLSWIESSCDGLAFDASLPGFSPLLLAALASLASRLVREKDAVPAALAGNEGFLIAGVSAATAVSLEAALLSMADSFSMPPLTACTSDAGASSQESASALATAASVSLPGPAMASSMVPELLAAGDTLWANGMPFSTSLTRTLGDATSFAIEPRAALLPSWLCQAWAMRAPQLGGVFFAWTGTALTLTPGQAAVRTPVLRICCLDAEVHC
mmetsp:Transcript_54280/g.117425  ORF Transcript_54280/g.117425 Transcript_54280/m.117425 type:complete len:215 (-) Transcript_54280:1980-2624(-)